MSARRQAPRARQPWPVAALAYGSGVRASSIVYPPVSPVRQRQGQKIPRLQTTTCIGGAKVAIVFGRSRGPTTRMAVLVRPGSTMPGSLRRVAVIGSARIPFARSNTRYIDAGNPELLTAAFAALVERFGLRGVQLGEVAAGAVIKHPRDWNLTREAALGAGLHPHTPAYDVQRACGTSLTTAIQIGQRIALGEIEAGIAGGVDTTSDVPIGYGRALNRIALDSARGRTWGARIRPWLKVKPADLKPATPGVVEPRTGLSMGEHCELMAKQWRIGRAEQDELAYRSHLNATAAWDSGFYDDLVVPFAGLDRDNNVRADTTPDKLAALKPVYDRSAAGTLTAGNSTPLTDGASSVLLASDAWAEARGLVAQAYLTHWSVAAVDFAGINGPPEGLLMAPTYAVP